MSNCKIVITSLCYSYSIKQSDDIANSHIRHTSVPVLGISIKTAAKAARFDAIVWYPGHVNISIVTITTIRDDHLDWIPAYAGMTGYLVE